jgi:sulfite reductase alpha subunit-like flavoprotein
VIESTSPDQIELGKSMINSLSLENNAMASSQTIFILYGSQTGASKSIAERVYSNAIGMNLCCSLACLNDFAGSSIATVRYLIVVCSTTGDGDAPNNADEYVCCLFFVISHKLFDLPDTAL